MPEETKTTAQPAATARAHAQPATPPAPPMQATGAPPAARLGDQPTTMDSTQPKRYPVEAPEARALSAGAARLANIKANSDAAARAQFLSALSQLKRRMSPTEIQLAHQYLDEIGGMEAAAPVSPTPAAPVAQPAGSQSPTAVAPMTTQSAAVLSDPILDTGKPADASKK
jgi:hypothetical protein